MNRRCRERRRHEGGQDFSLGRENSKKKLFSRLTNRIGSKKGHDDVKLFLKHTKLKRYIYTINNHPINRKVKG